MDKEMILSIVKRLTSSEREQFMDLLNEYIHVDKIIAVANTVHQNRKIEYLHCCNTDI